MNHGTDPREEPLMGRLVDHEDVVAGPVHGSCAPAGGDDGPEAGSADGIDDGRVAPVRSSSEAHAAEADVDRRSACGEEPVELGWRSPAVNRIEEPVPGDVGMGWVVSGDRSDVL